MDEINLAYKLEDGMKVHIPTVQEIEETKKTETPDLTEEYIKTESGLEINKTESEKTQNIKQTKININTATRRTIRNITRNRPINSN